MKIFIRATKRSLFIIKEAGRKVDIVGKREGNKAFKYVF